jgi:GntR family transcriptional regulator
LSNHPEPKPVRNDSRPLYSLTIEALTNLILEGGYKSGSRLPKEDVLSRQLGISRSTLRVALGYLETYGLISRRPGVGTFVATTVGDSLHGRYMGGLDRMETLEQIAARAGVTASIKSREIDDVKADIDIANILGIPQGEALYRIQVVEAIEGRIAALIDTCLPVSSTTREEIEAAQEDVITFLARKGGLKPTHTRSEISAVNSDARVAAKLEIDEGDAVLFLEETFHTREGELIAYSRNHFVSEVFHFYLIRRVVVGS